MTAPSSSEAGLGFYQEYMLIFPLLFLFQLPAVELHSLVEKVLRNEPVSVTGGRCEPGVAKPGTAPGQVEFYR